MGKSCVWASINEIGKLTGGTPGDQTGNEIKMGDYYQFGQTAVYVPIDKKFGKEIAENAEAISYNPRFGYSQDRRTSGFIALMNADWDLNKFNRTNKNVDLDCSELAAVCVNLAVKKMLIKMDTYSGNIGDRLVATGLFTKHTDEKLLKCVSVIPAGSIVVAPGKHVLIKIAQYNAAKPVKLTQNKLINKVVASGQEAANKFAGAGLSIDGIYGTEDIIAVVKCIQTALNKDIKAKLVVDGKFGPLTFNALKDFGNLEFGQKNYMVTVLEIILLMRGFVNPVEYPGMYGSRVANITKKNVITPTDIIKLSGINL